MLTAEEWTTATHFSLSVVRPEFAALARRKAKCACCANKTHDFGPDRFQDLFRFEDAVDVRHLMRVMEFPDAWEVPEGKFTGGEAMNLFLKRMAYPCRFVDLQGEMRAQKGALSSLFVEVTDWLTDRTDWLTDWCLYVNLVSERFGVRPPTL